MASLINIDNVCEPQDGPTIPRKHPNMFLSINSIIGSTL